jgi:hypothetical protein
MAEMTMTYSLEVDKLLARVDALFAHVASAMDGDPVKDLASEVGEIDVDADTEILTDFKNGALIVTLEPRGNLARLLDVFERAAP